MVNRCDNNHHHNNIEVEDVILTRPKFQQFSEEKHQTMHEIHEGVVTLLARKSYHYNNDQYIQRHAPNYKKIPFFDSDMCKLNFIN